jgi:hypothetical protein
MLGCTLLSNRWLMSVTLETSHAPMSPYGCVALTRLRLAPVAPVDDRLLDTLIIVLERPLPRAVALMSRAHDTAGSARDDRVRLLGGDELERGPIFMVGTGSCRLHSISPILDPC